jgi:hypothetical protein
MKKKQQAISTAKHARRAAATKKIRKLAGSLKGKGLMKSLMEEKKREREL